MELVRKEELARVWVELVSGTGKEEGTAEVRQTHMGPI